MRTDETRRVEDALKLAGFDRVDGYRYNSASIRLRAIDPRFDGLPLEERYALVEPVLEQLPERTQADILTSYAVGGFWYCARYCDGLLSSA